MGETHRTFPYFSHLSPLQVGDYEDAPVLL
jgi:hypothetical protein